MFYCGHGHPSSFFFFLGLLFLIKRPIKCVDMTCLGVLGSCPASRSLRLQRSWIASLIISRDCRSAISSGVMFSSVGSCLFDLGGPQVVNLGLQAQDGLSNTFVPFLDVSAIEASDRSMIRDLRYLLECGDFLNRSRIATCLLPVIKEVNPTLGSLELAFS